MSSYLLALPQKVINKICIFKCSSIELIGLRNEIAFKTEIFLGLKKLLRAEQSHVKETNELKLVDTVNTRHEKPSSARMISSVRNILSPRAVVSALGFGADKATTLMVGVENVLNARSDIEPIDRFISSFNNLFLSPAGIAINNYYNIFANFWVNFDAIAQFVRGLENRIVIRRANALAAAAEEESSAVVEETLLSLTAANAQLEEFKDNLSNLLRRHDIARVIHTSRRADTIDDNNENETDDYEEEDQDSDEENVNSITHQQINSPADLTNQKYSSAGYNDDINDID